MKNEYIKVFKALSDENRVRVLEILCDGEECACVLLDDMKISQPTLSHHMKILCDSGIVKGRKVGKWMYYSINEDGCQYARELLKSIEEHKMEKFLKIMVRFYGIIKPVKKFLSTNKEEQCLGCCCCETEDK